MKRLAGYIKRYALNYIIAIVALFAGVALDMVNPRVARYIIDDVITGGKIEMLKWALMVLGIITVSRAILGYIKEFLFDLGGSKIGIDLRKDLFDHIQSLPFSFFDNMNTGELMSRIKEDMDNIWQTMAFIIMMLIEQSTYFIVASILLFTLNWKLAFMSLLTMPVIAFLAVKMEGKVGKIYGAISDQGVVLNTTAQENIAGIRLVKAFGRERYEIQKFLKQNKENVRLNLEQAHIFSKFNPKIELLSNIAIVIVITFGGFLVMGDQMSLGTLVAFSSYIFMLIWPMRMIGWITNSLAQSMASLKKVNKIFNEVAEIKDAENPIVPDEMNGHVVFKDVSFEYNGMTVLKGINIDAEPGKTIAIMGVTGAGKSSIINLIGRYYDCSKGAIFVDDVNVKDMKLSALRKQMSVVMQDTFLFSDTIEENIRFGSPEVSEQEIKQAAKDAKIHDFIVQMADGYKTVVGERGIGLSGGQKQRIAIARALVKDSNILIMDDATSALDMDTEYQIQKALEHKKGITKFIIAYRISAVKNADEIIFIENGEIVERGSHEKLLEIQGRYYDIYCEQFKGLLDMPEEEEEVV